MRWVEAVYRLGVSLWAGGAFLFTLVLTPAIFRGFSRDRAAETVGLLFPGYFRWGVACGVVSLGAVLLLRGRYFPGKAVLLAVMIALVGFQAWYVEPRADALKKEIVSFETTTKDHPLRKEFSRLHAVSAVCNLVVMAGGAVLVVLP